MRQFEDETELPESSWWSQLVNWSLQPRILGTIALAGLFDVIIPAIPGLWPSVSQGAKLQMTLDRIDLTTTQSLDSTPAEHAVHRVTTRFKPHEIVQQVAQKHPEWKDLSLLDSTLVEDIAKAFEKYPWIASVDRVEKTRQGRILVQVTYRTPAAVVETPRGHSVVDARGNLLPNDLLPADYEQLPHLRGVHSIPNGPVGTPWGDPLVVAGAKLCEALMPQGTLGSHWSKYQLEAVLAPVPDRAPRADHDRIESKPEPPVLTLLTRGGGHIVWGRPPGEDSLEPSVEQKFGRLDSLMRDSQTLDVALGGKDIDIRGLDAIHIISDKTPEREKLR